ncbi:hypothetical protein OOK27_51255 [Streptomyces canus]|uniref:hypothetical protein n=2 Tax=Streptomyces canus TaxID=58343 RepID=UPI00225956AE|nr:hypothetical protein [Streptomyces canus]MCX5262394.1 hypothetical protein [Streptomyces canus]
MTASVNPAVGPPGECAKCADREDSGRRTKNRLITFGQSLIGAGQASLTGTGVWLFFGDQPAAAGAAAVLAGLGFPVIKGLSKLRPRPRN